jgi:hypothetical protein
VSELFVLGELPDELKNQRNVANHSRFYAKVGAHACMLAHVPADPIRTPIVRSVRPY